jgi:two-component system NtrC family sensor kinase
MSSALWSIWSVATQLGLSRLTAGECALLIVLGALLLVLRSFRERYLMIWVAGWTAFLASRLIAAHGSRMLIPGRYVPVAEHTTFVLAVGLFAAAVLAYTQARPRFIPLAAISLSLIGFAAARALLWPETLPLRMALEVAYRILLLAAAFGLIRSRWGRRELTPWLLGAGLLSMHLDWPRFTTGLPGGLRLAADLTVGLSVLLVVFEEARARTRRLRVIHALTHNIACAQQYGPMLQTALQELQQSGMWKAAWVRLWEGGHMVANHAVGVSPEFLRDAGLVESGEQLQEILEKRQARVVDNDEADPENPAVLKAEGLRQVVMVPMSGKKSPIGLLVMGSSRRRSWTGEELALLETCAQHLGMAVENFRLQEQALRSQRQWMNTFDSIHDIILAHDVDFRIIKANQVLLEHLGQATADVIGNTCESVLPHELGDWTGCPYCSPGGEEFTDGADPCFGGYSVVSTSSYTEQGSKQKGTIHVVRDITDRRSAEEKYRLLFEQVQEGVYVAAPTGKLLDCNDAFIHMLGYGGREELLALNLDSDICVDRNQRDEFRRKIDLHNFVRNLDVTLRRKDGTLLLAEESSFATRNQTGKIDRYQGFVLDMTEKRRAEDEMRRRNRELNALNAMAVVATQSFDLDEILNLTLRQVVSLFGAESGSVYLSDSDATTYRRRAMWGPRNRPGARAAEVSFVDGFGDLVMRSRTEVITSEYMPHLPKPVAEFIRSDSSGSWIWVLFWGKDSPIGIMGLCSYLGYEYSSNEENLLVAISRQLATTIEKVRLYEETCRAYEDLRRTQEQLLQSEKMSAVGQLIAGVAHELNNPLTAILGYAQLLEAEGLNERAHDYVGKLFKQAQRTHRVVQNLLSFARQRKPQREEVDIRKVLDETLALRDYDLKVNNIAIEKDAPAEAAPIVADPHQIEQVFLNIINNSVDAILETGRTGKLKIRVFCENGHVCTQFSDDGPGMKDPKRIFDPFYTTKSVGKGTGLGLSICYGIVKEHGGDITAHNGAGGGAVVEVRLPVAAQPASTPEREAAPAPRRESAIQGRVLLLEEEEAVLEFERDVLAGAGANVVTATKSADVKTRLLSEHFDAVIMNGKMPGDWNAKEAYTWIKQNCPGMDAHLLFTFSHGLEQGEIRVFLEESGIPYLVKPFEVADLISRARRLLQKAHSAAAS